MLLDYPHIKKRFRNKIFNGAYNRAEMKYAPIVCQSSKIILHEGHRNVLIREDGTVDDTLFSKTRGKMEVRDEEAENLTIDELLYKLEIMSKDMMIQNEKMALFSLEQLCRQTGNYSDAKGKPFSLEMLIEVLKKLELRFSEEGIPQFPTVITGDKLAKKVEEEWERLESDIELRRKLLELIDVKREEWRARESNRQLVD